MKHQKVLIFSFLCTINSFAAILSIPYGGGMQTGTFKISGVISPNVAPDTVTIDGSLLITNYSAEPSYSFCFGHNAEFGAFVANPGGTSGRKSSLDTVWEAATTYPGELIPLDTVPTSPLLFPSKSLPAGAMGRKMGQHYRGSECTLESYAMQAGFNAILYFQFNNGSPRYIKLQVRRQIDSANGFGTALKRLEVAYTISNSSDLNSGPVAITPARPTSKVSGKQLVWSRQHGVTIQDLRRSGILYDLKGKRITSVTTDP